MKTLDDLDRKILRELQADGRLTNEVPGKQTLKSNVEAKRVAIFNEDLDTSLMVRTVPRLDQTANLYAKFTLPKTTSPLMAGQVTLFRDGVLVGTGQMKALTPGEEHDLGFGSDERVKVKRIVLEDKKGETGTFTTSSLEERNFETTIRNLHPRPVTVLVLDRMPVSGQQDIKVEPSFRSPQPARKDIGDHRGTFLWELALDPDQEKKIAFGYRITSPKERPIFYFEKSLEDVFRFGGAIRF